MCFSHVIRLFFYLVEFIIHAIRYGEKLNKFSRAYSTKLACHLFHLSDMVFAKAKHSCHLDKQHVSYSLKWVNLTSLLSIDNDLDAKRLTFLREKFDVFRIIHYLVYMSCNIKDRMIKSEID